MGRPKKERPPLPTIWRASDALWARVAVVLAEVDPPRATGRRRVDQRGVFDAILFRLRSGCQWNQLPKEYPDDSTVHRTFQRWVDLGVFPALWATLVEDCDELGGVQWAWQAVDGAMGKARFGGIWSGPTRRTGAKPA